MPRQKKQVLKKRKDGRYCCKYKGVQFMGHTSDEALALREEYKRLESSGNPTRYITTVKDYAEPWFRRTFPKNSVNMQAARKKFLSHLVNDLGSCLICDVLPSQVKDIFSNHFAGLSSGYISTAKGFYISFFDAAVADGLCDRNPASDKAAKPHKGTHGSHRPITAQERYWIEHYCLDHRMHAAAMTMLYSGVRPQEVKAMTIENSIDFDNDLITVNKCVHLSDFTHYVISSEGKTEKATRTIPLFAPLKQTLQGRSGYIVSKASGELVSPPSFKRLWQSYKSRMEIAINGYRKCHYGRTLEHKKILQTGGKLPEWIEFTVVPYDLRHSFCVMCRDNGVELNTCIRWMGHTDSKMILRIYDSVSDDRSKKEAEKLNKTLLSMQNGMQEQKASL